MDESRSDLNGKLFGCRVVLTAQRKAEQFATALERHGAAIVHAPTLSVIPTRSMTPNSLHAPVHSSDTHPDIVVVTTGVGFNGWAEVAEAEGLSEQWHAMLTGAQIIARGPKARGAIQSAGLTPAWVARIRDQLRDPAGSARTGSAWPSDRGAAPRRWRRWSGRSLLRSRCRGQLVGGLPVGSRTGSRRRGGRRRTRREPPL